ncbi:MAG: hypothetical protein HY706_08755 [Candidatus Hydrogenedentes bacterium]|nr:hypothetical protein [Candidatus Hydrogenedentota bacterium]
MSEPPLNRESVSQADALEEALRRHALFAAERARAKLGGPLSAGNLSVFLNDQDCVRYPTSIVFDRAGLEPHQFGFPKQVGTGKQRRCIVHLDPVYETRPDEVPWLVAYLTPVINYGDIVTSEICELYGATLMGTVPQTFADEVARAAESCRTR